MIVQKNNLTVVMYHYVRDLQYSRYPRIKGLDVELFRQQLGFLKRHYHFVTVEEIVSAFENHRCLPDHPVLLTFDDAYVDHFANVFPILKKEHVSGAFYPPVKAILEHTVLDVNKIHFILAATQKKDFSKLLHEIEGLLERYREEYHLSSYETYYEKLAVANRFDPAEVIFVKRLLQVELDESLRKRITDELFTKVVSEDEEAFSRELYMSLDQLKCMVDCGMHVGSHGYDHYWLGALPRERQEMEICKSVEFIEGIGGNRTCWSMCYPYGNYNEDTLELLKRYGCRLGLTTRVGLTDLTECNSDTILTLPRLDTNDLPKNVEAAPGAWYL